MEKVFSRVLIKDEDHHMLVIQDRANNWNFPGGKQELGETPVECAKREIQEEIGLYIHQLTEVFQGDFISDILNGRAISILQSLLAEYLR